MSVKLPSVRTSAMTLIELLCVIGIITVLAALLLPAVNQAKAKARRIQCVDHLREVGVGFVAFGNDHHGQFPMAVPARDGGTLEFTRTGYSLQGDFYFCYRHFQAASNELVTPKLVVCPTDTRAAAENFPSLSNSNLSYFVGVNAQFSQPGSVLAGDRNLTNDFAAPASLARLGPNSALHWTAEMHRFKGNLLFADGHVEERNSSGLMPSAGQTPAVANLALPTVPSGSSANPGATAGRAEPFGMPTFAQPPATVLAIPNVQRPRAAVLAGMPARDSTAAKTSAPPVVRRQSTNASPPPPPPNPPEETATASQPGLPPSATANLLPEAGLFWLFALLLLILAVALVRHKRARARNKARQRARTVLRFR